MIISLVVILFVSTLLCYLVSFEVSKLII